LAFSSATIYSLFVSVAEISGKSKSKRLSVLTLLLFFHYFCGWQEAVNHGEEQGAKMQFLGIKQFLAAK
jgi:apolipoprotein N-acyltransferase